MTAQSNNMGRTSLPLVSLVEPSLSEYDRQRLDKIALLLQSNEPALANTKPFGNKVQSGLADGPAVLISNSNDIPLLETGKPSSLEYRMSLLAQDGDLFVLRGERNVQFERYRQEILALGEMHVVPIDDKNTISGVLVSHIEQYCKEDDLLSIIPYIGLGSIWKLAAELAETTGRSIRVATAPPRLTRRVNDKLWFASRVSDALGKTAVPEYFAAYGPAGLTGLIQRVAKRYPELVVKVPDSAGSMGNIKLERETVQSVSAKTLQSMVLDRLHARSWHNSYPVMVEAWDAPIISSPSVQIWVPKKDIGLPVIEGIFVQLVHGESSSFAGATIANMPQVWEERITEQAQQLAYLFQSLGYFGRLSFDLVITGDDYGKAELHWIECNGRWGGVSIPMTLLNRLLNDYRDKSIIIMQHNARKSDSVPFEEAYTLLENLLFVPGKRDSGAILPIPNAAYRGAGSHFIVIADSMEEAQIMVQEINGQLV